jgi:hypothetical protein
MRSPELVADDIARAAALVKAPIFILGDLRHNGEEWADRLLRALGSRRVRNHAVVELFWPAPAAFMRKVAQTLPNFNLQMSPESHDEKVRAAFGRSYANADLERSIEDAFAAGCRRMDLFFMTGLPFQTKASVFATIDYCETLLARFNPRWPRRLVPYISPLAPFIDPGSMVFSDPEKYGYSLFCRTLEEHRAALLQPSWKYMLSYETKWMDRGEIVDATYTAAARLNELKRQYRLIDRDTADAVAARIREAQRTITEVDRIMKETGGSSDDRRLDEIGRLFARLNSSTICDKARLEWPLAAMRFNPAAIIRELFRQSDKSGRGAGA